jgi:Tfp pilus assembly protein FimT
MNSQAGVTILEIVVVVALIGLSLSMSSMYLQPIEAPLKSGAALLEGFFRQARLNAIATTSAYRVFAQNPGRLMAETAASCSDTTWATVNGMTMNLPDDVSLTSTTWIACFSSRGISASNVKIGLTHPQAGSVAIELLIGGTTRVLE